MDQNLKQQIIERLNGATNVLVTVSANPSVDQLAACIGLTLILNKLGKHATAVFSGAIPSTLEFLQPEATLEKNTDSLRDFIIALDKSKADKLRYKVEDKLVRIFITPYKTSISQKDLEFSQGDFNVDAVVALGVQNREDLDKAITAHGRILHDATVISVNRTAASNLGTLNWQDAQSSSLCEMVVDLGETLQPDSFDAQTATALLTGIVAETERFSNVKTSPRTMSLSAKLMAAGANQQLVAAKLQTKVSPGEVAQESATGTAKKDEPGTLEISHSEAEEQLDDKAAPTLKDTKSPLVLPQSSETKAASDTVVAHTAEPTPTTELPELPKIGDVKSSDTEASTPTFGSKPTTSFGSSSSVSTQPPALGGTLTANTQPEPLSSGIDSLASSPATGPILSHGTADIGQIPPVTDDEKLNEIEAAVDSPHIQQENLEEARSAVEQAVDAAPATQPSPLTAVGAQPLDLNVQQPAAAPVSTFPEAPPLETPATSAAPAPAASPSPAVSPEPIIGLPSPAGTQSPAPALPTSLVPPDPGLPAEQTGATAPVTPPPPVPPPMLPPS